MTLEEQASLKPCPFCGSKAQIETRSERHGYGEYETIVNYMYAVCDGCQAESQKIVVKPLCDFTNYRVADFRNNPILRAKVEDEYQEFCDKIKKQVCYQWNTRMEGVI